MSRKYIFGGFLFFAFLPLSSNTYAGQQAATYGKASSDTIGIFSGCQVGIPCPIKISTNVQPSIRQCQYWDEVPPLYRIWDVTEEARYMGISASGYITIYPGRPITLAAGQWHVTNNEWGNPAKCGHSELQWPIQGISVTFSRPLLRSEFPVRVLAMGRGRMQFIKDFNTKTGRDQAAVNIVIDGSFADSNPEVIAPYCSVSGDALIEHGSHTPDSIKNNIAKSSPVTISCNTDVKAKVSIKGGQAISGRSANWTQCGYGACEIAIDGNSEFDIEKTKTIRFISTWHSLGNSVREGSFEGSAIASITYQ
ncbi:TPA: hypothetical protein IGZ71_003874 [Escherichia coli]|nr:hypothetical protein [Escherichia coli]